MNTEQQQKLNELREEFEKVLAEYLEKSVFQPAVLSSGIHYALENGGKRLRPVLMFAVAQMFGGKTFDVQNLALALEMIHTYSLIHDDLPAMDNDDFRHGVPSAHKQFGEGQAVLIGDALLNEAYRICFDECLKGRTYRNAAEVICKNAGADGMIAGQAADLYWENREGADLGTVNFIVLNKTARMLMSAVSVPAYVYGADENITELLNEFGKNFGFLFQITDDLLDVDGSFEKLGKSIGKDEQEQKLTFISLFGKEKTEELADTYCQSCLDNLSQLPYSTEFLQELTRHVRHREA